MQRHLPLLGPPGSLGCEGLGRCLPQRCRMPARPLSFWELQPELQLTAMVRVHFRVMFQIWTLVMAA